jgi:hypothetical protein
MRLMSGKRWLPAARVFDSSLFYQTEFPALHGGQLLDCRCVFSRDSREVMAAARQAVTGEKISDRLRQFDDPVRNMTG